MRNKRSKQTCLNPNIYSRIIEQKWLDIVPTPWCACLSRGKHVIGFWCSESSDQVAKSSVLYVQSLEPGPWTFLVSKTSFEDTVLVYWDPFVGRMKPHGHLPINRLQEESSLFWNSTFGSILVCLALLLDTIPTLAAEDWTKALLSF